MISHLSLTPTKSLSKSINLAVDENGFEFLMVNHPKLTAAFSLHGGHLLHFQVTGQAPIIWLSKTAIFNESKAIRGGVPVCWPWFGAAPQTLGENLPAHGFARTSKWTIGNIDESNDGVELELQLTSNSQTLLIWPYEFELTLKATLTDQLKLTLETKNKSDKPLVYRGALHTYLNISTPEAINISGLNTELTNSLKDGSIENGDTTLVIDKAIDAIYKKSPGNIELADKQLDRSITINNEGNDSEVLWSPWIKGAEAFADMPDDGYQTMFCIESAITAKHGQQIEAGQTHHLTTIIK